MVVEGPIGHVIVDEDHFTVLITVANKRDKVAVAVAEMGEHLYLSFELVEPLWWLRLQSFDGNLGGLIVDVLCVHGIQISYLIFGVLIHIQPINWWHIM